LEIVSIKFRKFWTAASTGALLVSLAGCQAPAAGPEVPIRIGASLPLTGEFSQGGADTQRGYEVWAKLQNERGGILGREVEMIYKDDATNQNTVVSNYNQLLHNEGVNLLLGTQSSLLNIPASTVAERAGMLYICASCASPEMFNRGFKFSFFSQQAMASDQGATFADWIIGLPKDKRPQKVAYPSLDDPFATPVVEGIRKKLEAAGIETAYADAYPVATKNFDAIVTAIRESGAEAVVQGAQFEDGVNFVRALNRADFHPKILYQSSSPTYGQQYVDGVGEANTEGVLFSSSYHVDADTKGNKEFAARYREIYGGYPPEDAADGYAAGQVLAAVVEGVGSTDDQKALADWLRGNEVETVLGKLSWNEDGSPRGDFLLGQWQNNVSEVVLPGEAATTTRITRWRGEAF
jgi:branched-chain amino acid transport system substrate-binding protein